MNGKNLQELIKNLQVFYKCPSCGSQYRHEDITFLGRVDEHCFMQLTCDACSLPILATVLLSSDIVPAKASPATQSDKLTQKAQARYNRSDLVRGEKQRFASSEAIDSAEIAELHLYLSDHSTDLHSRF